jgi:hypothetical protein
MKPRRKRAKARARTFRVWTQPQAEAAVPFITSVMQSVREHFIQRQARQLHLERLESKPGRPNRGALLALETARHDAAHAEEQFADALNELWRLNIYCLDPAQGLALIPFAHPDEQLAWFVFELFEKEKLRFWRFHGDPLETRRPLPVVTEPPSLTV